MDPDTQALKDRIGALEFELQRVAYYAANHAQEHPAPGMDPILTTTIGTVVIDHTLASHISKAHSELTGIGASDHHAEAHTLLSHSTRPHADLTSVLADQHHAQAHVTAHIAGGSDPFLLTQTINIDQIRFGNATGPLLNGPASGDDLALTGDLVASGSFVPGVAGGLFDADRDTGILVEKTADLDEIWFQTGGAQPGFIRSDAGADSLTKGELFWGRRLNVGRVYGDIQDANALKVELQYTPTTAGRSAFAIDGSAIVLAGTTINPGSIVGMRFTARNNQAAGGASALVGILFETDQANAGGNGRLACAQFSAKVSAGPVSRAVGGEVVLQTQGGSVTDLIGLYVRQEGVGSTVTNAHGLKIEPLLLGTVKQPLLVKGTNNSATAADDAYQSYFEGAISARAFIPRGDLLITGDSDRELIVKRAHKLFTTTITGTIGLLLDASQHTHTADVNYKVEIDTAGDLSAATFRWSDDGGATWDATLLPCGEDPGGSGTFTGRNVLLQNKVRVIFTSTGTAVLGDNWTWTAIGTANQIAQLRCDTTNERVEVMHELTLLRSGAPTDRNAFLRRYLVGGNDQLALTAKVVASTPESAVLYDYGSDRWQIRVLSNSPKLVVSATQIGTADDFPTLLGSAGTVDANASLHVSSGTSANKLLKLPDSSSVNRPAAPSNGMLYHDTGVFHFVCRLNAAYRELLDTSGGQIVAGDLSLQRSGAVATLTVERTTSSVSKGVLAASLSAVNIGSVDNTVVQLLQNNAVAAVIQTDKGVDFKGTTNAIRLGDTTGRYIQIGNVTALPTASATYQDRLVVLRKAGAGDDEQFVCLQRNGGGYAWVKAA